ncbi:DUF4142 domain-containing protein [Hydrogenophaga sp. A37]|uniref:DUF4142 domain-containing protein n=1 Tax=Hydrogenophaga sp. A37 TaxID=1945864 RepID=UPI0009CF86B7|nr:DUF4142 domain-containing protein [Hydrogenophaga sp. A37]OOG88669.1 hypothetical protein B0E41_01620 [Hydrogenophaga sp. A37]
MRVQTLRCATLVLALMFGGPAFADKLAEGDQEFLEQAAQNGLAEQSASRLALTKARDQRVRDFAQRMVDEHARVDTELQTLARSKDYTPPKEPSMLQKGKELLIANLGDESFDRRYVSQMGVEAHESNVRLFEAAAREARDPDVKAFATKHLPALRDHLETARTLMETVNPARTIEGKR